MIEMIKAVIFDMDGVMIDSEPFWQRSEKRVFGEIGVDLSTEQMEQTKGMRIDEVVRYWHNRFPWDAKQYPLEEREKLIVQGVVELVLEEGEALAGLHEALDLIKSKDLKIGLATSSDTPLIEAVCKSLNIQDYFDVQVSARVVKNGKPAPDVYLLTAEKLGVNPQECLAIEDSANGLLSALRADMRTVVIPRPEYPESEVFKKADYRLAGLDQFSAELLS